MAASTEKSGCLPQFFRKFVDHDSDMVDSRYRVDFESTNQSNEIAILPSPGKAQIAPYRLRDDFLSAAELSLFYVLKQLVGDQAVIMAKVRLADVFFVAKPHEHAGAFSQISQKHIDFLICHPQTLKPLLGIELDDSSHQASKRQTRDEFVNDVFKEAQLPLLRIPVQRSYDRAQLLALMLPYLNPSASLTAVGVSLLRDVHICPKCGVDMVLRTAKQGKHIGEQFYACPNYPRCRETAKA